MQNFFSIEHRLSKSNLTPSERHFADNVLAVVRKHYSETTFDMSLLASELGYSRTQVYRKLKKLLGVTGSEFILCVRMEIAARLLKKEPIPIGEISKKVGMKCPSYFARQFKLFYGCLPREYRVDKVNVFESGYLKSHSSAE